MADDSNSTPVESSTLDSQELRIDDAHPMRRAIEEASEEGTAVVAPALKVPELATVGAGTAVPLSDRENVDESPRRPKLIGSPQVLAQHAADLADRLQQQLADVDRRESRLNSQEAEFDSRIRNARLWIEDREKDLGEREEQVRQQEEALQQEREAATELLSEAEDLGERLAEVETREQAVTKLQLELEIALTEQQTKNDALDFQRAACRTKEEECEAARSNFEERHRDLDQREAELYVEQERHSEQRQAFDCVQAGLLERETELTRREATLARTEEKLTQQASEIEFQRAELQQARLEHEDRESELEEAKSRLVVRQREIETALERFERLGIVEEREAELDQQAAEFDMRSKYLDNAEALLTEQHQQHSAELEAFEKRRREYESEILRERRTLEQQREEIKREGDARSAELDLREAELDQRQQACELLSTELRKTQREALEMRLATEETWQQLQGVLAPATLTRSIAIVRSRIADHFQLAADEVAAQRAKLEALRVELNEQHDRLSERSRELQRWSQVREQDLESQAARLVAREQELDEQAREAENLKRSWETERRSHLEEKQCLLAELRHATVTDERAKAA